MVKVDELNEKIEQFSTVVKKLDTLAESSEAIERTSKMQEEMVNKFEKQSTETQLAINTRMDNMENHLLDKLELSEQKINREQEQLSKTVSEQIGEIKKEIEDQSNSIKMEIAEFSKATDEKLKSIKTLQYVAIACAVVAAVLTVVMSFIQ